MCSVFRIDTDKNGQVSADELEASPLGKRGGGTEKRRGRRERPEV